jgi:hypothetical protein
VGLTESSLPRCRYPQALEFAGDLLNDRALGRQQGVGVVKAGERTDLVGDARQDKALAGREKPVLSGLAQLLQAGGQIAGIVFLQCRGEKIPHLVTQSLILGRRESVPETLAAEADLERLPGALVGLGEGL